MESLNSQDRAEAIRTAILNDLYFLVKFVLGYWWLCREPHKAFCEEIQKDINFSLYLLPRGNCKTQIFNTGHTIQCYLRNPDESIAIFCDIQKRASWKLRPLKFQLENNKTLKECFPDLLYKNPKRESQMWNQEEIELPGHEGQQEPSIGCYGLDNQPTSLHFPRIKGDDLVTDKTVTTAEQLKKNIDQFGSMRSAILQTSGNLQICGTIYDDGDLHRTLEDSGIYRVYRRPAEWKDKNGQRRTLWSVQYGPEALDAIKNDPAVSIYIYSCNYLLDPAPDDENAFFQLSWFPRYKVLPKRLTYFAAADLAISEKETACETAIIVGGVCGKGNLYIAHVRKGHWGSLEIIDNLLAVQAEYNPDLFSLEAENIQRTIMPFLKLAMRERNIYLNVDAKTPVGDKVSRARPFQGRSKQGHIYLPAKDKDQPDWLWHIEYQLRKFPRAKEKDITDSGALLCEQLAGQWGPWDKAEDKPKKANDYNIDGQDEDPGEGWKAA